MEAFDLKLQTRSEWVKTTAVELGFLDCRIAKADKLEDEEPFLDKWLKENKNGSMSYLEENFEKRLDPRRLVDGAKSVIVLSLNYYSDEKQVKGAPKISKYAYGRDYHKVIKKRLKQFLYLLNEQFGEVNGRGFVDSAPVMEKAWARKSGLGWMGKHSNVLSKKAGSFYFIAELIVDLDLDYDTPVTDHCGSCTACIDACPTQAIYEPYKVDGSKCISYYTIELKNAIPEAARGTLDDWAFGCDVCQDVCPWNRFSKSHSEPLFEPNQQLLEMSKRDWEEITQEVFSDIFQKSAVKRTKYTGLQRNIEFLKK